MVISGAVKSKVNWFVLHNLHPGCTNVGAGCKCGIPVMGRRLFAPT